MDSMSHASRARHALPSSTFLELWHGVGDLSEVDAEDHRVVPAGLHGGNAGYCLPREVSSLIAFAFSAIMNCSMQE
jgi:hypothetical protein